MKTIVTLTALSILTRNDNLKFRNIFVFQTLKYFSSFWTQIITCHTDTCPQLTEVAGPQESVVTGRTQIARWSSTPPAQTSSSAQTPSLVTVITDVSTWETAVQTTRNIVEVRQKVNFAIFWFISQSRNQESIYRINLVWLYCKSNFPYKLDTETYSVLSISQD